MLVLYNSLTNRKQPFEPIEPGKVRVYVCGITVYDYCHIGHARVLTVFDMVVRWLRARGFQVTYVRNITDIDDKIIRRALENQETVEQLTSRFIDAMHEDADRLGLLRPDHEPRATQFMSQIIGMIESLMDKGYAYQGESGDVYYDVSRFDGYGKLSGKNPKELRAGTRVEIVDAKDDPLDFVLWKAAKPGEPQWDSPWGAGRPGWHIECSAMSIEHLGTHFDIHGGGMDLQFPHHENEIAQSEAATGEPFVNYWMHNGFVRVNEEKMSKSLGNFFTVREVFKRHYKAEEIRFFILNSHYRSPLNYSKDQLDSARAGLTRFYLALRGLPMAEPPAGTDYEARFNTAMDDDFNTPEAMAVLSALARDVNRARERDGETDAAPLGALLKKLGSSLGLLQADPNDHLKRTVTVHEAGTGDESVTKKGVISAEQVEELITQRAAARKNKNWAEADRIRDKLQVAGVVLEDGAQGTTWRRE